MEKVIKSKINVALFGFGRIGRNLFRLALNDPQINVVAISEKTHIEALHYLLVRDSIHGLLDTDIKHNGDSLLVGKNKVDVLDGGKPGNVGWNQVNADVIIDATGKYLKRKQLEKHIEDGAKKVIVTGTPDDKIDRIVIPGINDNTIMQSDQIISTTSSTTQVLALMVKILNQHYGLKRAMMTTVHAYTSDQPLTDAFGIDLRRSRSAVENIIPNTSSAPKIVEMLMPEFKGKLDGLAFNVPVPNGSCVDLTTELDQMPSVEEVNEVLKEESINQLTGLIGYTDDPIVSSDVIGRDETMVFDAKATMITSDSLLKTICWYDNGWGFSKRILDIIKKYYTKE
ncbi:MAG: type I glyceraldehyde-3-phosphate dehydrogenase [Candidatus Marinimicrobia bacterium]|nr:type I glyceraldehyde-3-phosphate dehydrogenase [Candidatus Neomarinimicrobiota bacterium]